jgi:dienelactone hydrolase
MTQLRRAGVSILLLSSLLVSVAVAQKPPADEWLARPVNDKTFRTYLDFFVYDKKLPLELKVLDVEEKEGVKKEHLSFQSTPGVRVFANLYSPTGPASRNAPALILLHGGTPQGKEGPRVVAEALARGGYVVFAIDMLYFGERKSGLMTTFTEQEKHERLYNQPSEYLAWVMQTVKDAGRSLDLLVAERGVDPKRVGFAGHSRGATVGVIVAAVERRLAAVALLLPAHFDALERQHLPAACPANYIGRISPRPLLSISGNYDTDHIKETSVAPLLKLAKQPKKNIWSETGHQITEEHRALLLQWLRENLK